MDQPVGQDRDRDRERGAQPRQEGEEEDAAEADCIDELNLGAAGLIPPLFSRLPKEALPPFRYIPTGAPGAGGTTVVSSAAGVLSRRGLISPSTRNAARSFGRMASRVATPLTLAEGAWSYGIIGYCMKKCEPECKEEPAP
jgi:hypothetical protein